MVFSKYKNVFQNNKYMKRIRSNFGQFIGGGGGGASKHLENCRGGGVGGGGS